MFTPRHGLALSWIKLCFRTRFHLSGITKRFFYGSVCVFQNKDVERINPNQIEIIKPIKSIKDHRDASDDTINLTDFYQQLRDVTDKFTDRVDGEYIVFVQVGSFYELYFEQAEKYAKILGITLTKKKLKSQDVPFAGFPDYKLDKYLRIAFTQGLKAVVCNQQRNEFNNVIGRSIDRLVTPGTVIDDGLRDFHRNNHLLAVTFPENPFKYDTPTGKIGLAWCDVSLGTFYVLETDFHDLMSAITRINPSEILIDSTFEFDRIENGSIGSEFCELKNYYVTKYHQPSTRKSINSFAERFAENKKLVISTFEDLKQKELSASQFLLSYLDACLPNYKTSFQLPTRSLPSNAMRIGPRAAKDLELIETIRGGMKVGALSNIIDRTVTNPGARLLNSWLLMPSTDVKEIKRRQKLVMSVLKHPIFAEELVLLLKRTSDIDRILRRIDNNRANYSEYLDLASTIFLLEEIYGLVKENKNVHSQMSYLFKSVIKNKKIKNLAESIEATIDSRGISQNTEHGFKMDVDIRRMNWNLLPDSSGRMHKLRTNYNHLLTEFISLEQSLTDILASKGYQGSIHLIRHIKTGEYLVDMKSTSKTFNDIIASLEWNSKYKTKHSVKLSIPEWKKLGEAMVQLEGDISLEESVIMRNLKQRIMKLADSLKEISPIIKILDITQSFANMAAEKDLISPIVDNSSHFDVINGRHLVVEEGLGDRSTKVENFTTNSCHLSSGHGWVITGPNMGGKSTFLRQNALIAILAQIGSFVPAQSAQIGVIDKVFTRVGSSDNIYKNQSTFMVEMNETAVILREATSRSLVIVDELGRGTSTKEGVAIAYASLHTMILKNKAKVLFATHLGPELSTKIKNDDKLEKKIEFYKTDLIKLDRPDLPIDERIIFDHHLKRGLSKYSHAIEVAELAGFPENTVNIARTNL